MAWGPVRRVWRALSAFTGVKPRRRATTAAVADKMAEKARINVATATFESQLYLPRMAQVEGGASSSDSDSDSDSSGSGGGQGFNNDIGLLLQPIEQDTAHPWVVFMLMLEVFVAMEVPFSVAFADGLSPWLVAQTIVIGLLFLLDVVVKLRQPRTNSFGESIPPGRKAASRYIFAKLTCGRRTWFALRPWFVIDMIAVLPLVLLPIVVAIDGVATFRILFVVKCLWFLRVEDAVPFLGHLSVVPAALWRIGRLLFMLVTLSHWTGCLWFGVSDSQARGSGSLPWTHVTSLYDGGPAITDAPRAIDKYVVSLTTGLFLLNGESVNFQTRNEYLLAFACLVAGAFMYGTVLGQMAAYVESMISLASRSARHIDTVDAIMRNIALPARVQTRVHSFYDYMYRVHGVSSPSEEMAFLNDLTPNLRQQIMIHKCKNIIAKCPLFTTMPTTFGMELLAGLDYCVFMPGDFICQIGAMDKDMFFVSKGQVMVMDRNNNIIVVLGRGDYFGEIAALLGLRRMAKTMAVTWCEMLRLEHEKFEQILVNFPKEAAQLRKRALDRCQQSDSIGNVRFQDRHGSNKRLAALQASSPPQPRSDSPPEVHVQHVSTTPSKTGASIEEAKSVTREALATPPRPSQAAVPPPPPMPAPVGAPMPPTGMPVSQPLVGGAASIRAVMQEAEARHAALCAQLTALQQHIDGSHAATMAALASLMESEGVSLKDDGDVGAHMEGKEAAGVVEYLPRQAREGSPSTPETHHSRSTATRRWNFARGAVHMGLRLRRQSLRSVLTVRAQAEEQEMESPGSPAAAAFRARPLQSELDALRVQLPPHLEVDGSVSPRG